MWLNEKYLFSNITGPQTQDNFCMATSRDIRQRHKLKQDTLCGGRITHPLIKHRTPAAAGVMSHIHICSNIITYKFNEYPVKTVFAHQKSYVKCV